MSRSCLKILAAMAANLALLAAGLGGIAYQSAALADEPEPTPEPVQTITITIQPTPSPVPIPRPAATVYDYQLGEDAINAVARGMWGLDTQNEKAGFACLVINRAFCGKTREDGTALFGNGIVGVVEKENEFLFYNPDAPVTAQNYDYAEYCLNAQITYWFTKKYTGIVFPTTLLYMGWDNGEACFYTERGADPWRLP